MSCSWPTRSRQSPSYVPDVEARAKAPTHIVSAAGESSGEQAARRSAIALAERLGIPVTYLPGGHGGFGADPGEFAERVHQSLRGAGGAAED